MESWGIEREVETGTARGREREEERGFGDGYETQAERSHHGRPSRGGGAVAVTGGGRRWLRGRARARAPARGESGSLRGANRDLSPRLLVALLGPTARTRETLRTTMKPTTTFAAAVHDPGAARPRRSCRDPTPRRRRRADDAMHGRTKKCTSGTHATGGCCACWAATRTSSRRSRGTRLCPACSPPPRTTTPYASGRREVGVVQWRGRSARVAEEELYDAPRSRWSSSPRRRACHRVTDRPPGWRAGRRKAPKAAGYSDGWALRSRRGGIPPFLYDDDDELLVRASAVLKSKGPETEREFPVLVWYAL